MSEIDPKIKKRIRSIVFCALQECIKKKYRIELSSHSILISSNNKYFYNLVDFYNPLEFRLKGKNFKSYHHDLGKLYGISADDASDLRQGFMHSDDCRNSPFVEFGRTLNFECRLILKMP